MQSQAPYNVKGKNNLCANRHTSVQTRTWMDQPGSLPALLKRCLIRDISYYYSSFVLHSTESLLLGPQNHFYKIERIARECCWPQNVSKFCGQRKQMQFSWCQQGAEAPEDERTHPVNLQGCLLWNPCWRRYTSASVTVLLSNCIVSPKYCIFFPFL